MPQEKPTILVIDDELLNIEIVAESLESDFEIICATDGIEGIRIAGAEMPDLILLDVVMPGIDGYEVCARLKADPATAGIPIIFITALHAVEQEVRGLEAGAVDYVTKPINPLLVRVRVQIQMELRRARKRLEELATTDGLTGLANRRCFDERMTIEFDRLKRTGSRLSVIMIDVDHFKLFNDAYGHQAGDYCLRNVAKVIHLGARRPADLAARYGGEEFICLLPEVDQAGAQVVAEKIRKGIEELAIEHRQSTTGSFVTASLGIATCACNANLTANQLIAIADDALYMAKRAGRNRCESKAL
jgi:diguanylate cyclase (GGDEF)-like protein